MKHPVLLPLLLLGTVAAFHLENHALHLDSQETQADLSQDLEGSGDQEGELALTEEEVLSEEEQVEASSYQNDFEEKAVKLDPNALDNKFLCPRTEDTVEIMGSPGCKTCRYILVQTPQAFSVAQNTCRRCYRGNLASIHNFGTNHHLQCTVGQAVNQGQVWIGGFMSGWFHCWRYFWSDGSCWNYANWAPGQPNCGVGRCVALCTRGGLWRRAPCCRHLPFICSV